MAAIRRTIFFSGRVQGVGFRYTACYVATRFDVAGFVRNLPDGRVELVAEGEPQELDAFVAGVKQAMSGCVSRVESADEAARGDFTEFGVRH